jgi:hypothetical protein
LGIDDSSAGWNSDPKIPRHTATTPKWSGLGVDVKSNEPTASPRTMSATIMTRRREKRSTIEPASRAPKTDCEPTCAMTRKAMVRARLPPSRRCESVMATASGYTQSPRFDTI